MLEGSLFAGVFWPGSQGGQCWQLSGDTAGHTQREPLWRGFLGLWLVPVPVPAQWDRPCPGFPAVVHVMGAACAGVPSMGLCPGQAGGAQRWPSH